jgi:hypothetical protein
MCPDTCFDKALTHRLRAQAPRVQAQRQAACLVCTNITKMLCIVCCYLCDALLLVQFSHDGHHLRLLRVVALNDGGIKAGHHAVL